MTDQQTLLRHFAESQNERAFTELVSRHLEMVHRICRRRTGDAQLADEFIQNIFFARGRMTRSIRKDILVLRWLHRTSWLESLRALHAELLRRKTVEKFQQFHPTSNSNAAEVLPDLTLWQGGKKPGQAEFPSQWHLPRVLEKQRDVFRKRGVAIGVVTAGIFLSINFAKTAPDTLVHSTASIIAIAQASASNAMKQTFPS